MGGMRKVAGIWDHDGVRDAVGVSREERHTMEVEGWDCDMQLRERERERERASDLEGGGHVRVAQRDHE